MRTSYTKLIRETWEMVRNPLENFASLKWVNLSAVKRRTLKRFPLDSISAEIHLKHFFLSFSTDHLATNMGTVGSHPGSARTSAECSLASSRESSTTTVPYKVVMLGAAGVGKTSLVSQFMTSEYLHAYDTSLGEFFSPFHFHKENG